MSKDFISKQDFTKLRYYFIQTIYGYFIVHFIFFLLNEQS